MATKIAANAWVDPKAQLGEDVEIGPFCVVGPDVKIGDGTRLLNSATLMGRVTMGRGNVVYANSVIGAEPQDISYGGADTCVQIGDNNVFREGVTVNRASEKEDGITRIGDHNLLMACTHVAHDCKLGNHIIIANSTLLGGHVHVHDRASISGAVVVHHYATIGSFSFISGLSRVLHDVPPFMLCEGSPARPRCINIVALKRNNFDKTDVDCLAEAHRLLYRSKVGIQAARDVLGSTNKITPSVQDLFGFIDQQNEGRHGRSRDIRHAA